MSAAATTEAATSVLSELGYEPCQESQRCVRLGNCPFDAVAGVATEVVCGLNLRFVTGVLDGLDGHRSVEAVLDPAPDRCCVALTTRSRQR